MKLRWLRDQRGSILLFTTVLVVPLMIIFGGLAMDLAYHGTVDDELQRAMDAAALAGAGKLGFDSKAFGAVRQSAQDYAVGNPYRSENLAKQINTSNFTWTTANNSGDNIVLGIWNAGTFAPSLEGNKVNAVRCQFSSSIPTSFLRLIGINSLPTTAQAVAIANPPATPGCGTPILPIAVVPCAFQDAGGGFNNSNGCGASLTWISSSKCTSQSGSQFCNTAAWASLDGSTPNAKYIEDSIKNAASKPPACNVTKGSGQDTPVNNGMITGKAFETLKASYKNDRTPTLPSGDIVKADGSVIYAASKGGWETGVMLIKVDSCPPGPITGDHTVMTYSKFVVTQVYDGNDKKGGYCSTMPNPDPQAEPYCSAPKAGETAVFGYFRCDQLGHVATLDPVPRAALAQKLRLVR
jgi:Flp pilus assembly protein TadG